MLLSVILSLVTLLPTPVYLPRQEAKSCETIIASVSPSEAKSMEKVIVSGVITNCGPVDRTFRGIGGQISACGHRAVFAENSILLKSGQSQEISAPTVSAPDTCPGDVVIVILVVGDDDEIIAKKVLIIKAK